MEFHYREVRIRLIARLFWRCERRSFLISEMSGTFKQILGWFLILVRHLVIYQQLLLIILWENPIFNRPAFQMMRWIQSSIIYVFLHRALRQDIFSQNFFIKKRLVLNRLDVFVLAENVCYFGLCTSIVLRNAPGTQRLLSLSVSPLLLYNLNFSLLFVDVHDYV